MAQPQVLTLTDSAIGSQASILAGYGFNCFRFQAMDRGEPIDILWSEPDFADGNGSPSGSGNPILFPFPGRIPGVRLSWDGKHYELEPGDGRGNAIHGFVHERPWRVLEQTSQHAIGCFQAGQDDPELLSRWPADFRITAEYRLNGNSLSLILTMENPGQAPLPCGLGVHPYFQIPLGGDAKQCFVELPVTEQWELVEMLPTGRRLVLENPHQYHQGLPFEEMALDDVFTGLRFEDGWCAARIVDRAANRSLTLSFDSAFRECVVYNPAHRQAVCVEPYTCVPGPFGLTEKGINAGLRVLAPGESFLAKMEMRLESTSTGNN